jgi:hypothetical protein
MRRCVCALHLGFPLRYVLRFSASGRANIICFCFFEFWLFFLFSGKTTTAALERSLDSPFIESCVMMESHWRGCKCLVFLALTTAAQVAAAGATPAMDVHHGR